MPDAQPHSADCSECGWQQIFFNENEAKLCSVLHVLIRHPDTYARTTGKDPAEMEFEYRDYILAYKEKL